MLRRHISIKNKLIGFVKKEFHKLGVSSAVIDKLNNRILLIKREKLPYNDKWCFPGGSVEKHEKYLDATTREIKEETGVEVTVPEIHLLKIVYVGQFMIISSISEFSGEIKTPISYIHQGIHCKWWDYEEVLNADICAFVHGIKELIPKAYALHKLNYNKN